MFLVPAPHKTRADSGRIEPNIDTIRSFFKHSLKIRVHRRRQIVDERAVLGGSLDVVDQETAAPP